MKISGYLALLVMTACVAPPPSTDAVEQHSDNTCVSDPLAPGGDDGGPDGDLVAQCHQDQVYNTVVNTTPPDSRIGCQLFPSAVRCTAVWWSRGTWGDCQYMQCTWTLATGVTCENGILDSSFCS